MNQATHDSSANLAEMTPDQARQALHVSEEGLSSSEAADRLERYGPNALAETHVSPLIKFLLYFWGPIPWMIEVAAILSALVRHWPELIIIVVLLMVNAVIGFLQEHKADNAIELLKKKLALKARVRRDGKWTSIAASELVPGDLVRIRLGDVTPADVKLIHADNVSSDQSALTGESLPVDKHPGDVAYSGSVIQRGEADGLVIATGAKTLFGRTAQLAGEAVRTSHYQKAVLKIGHFLIMVTLAMVSVIIIAALFRYDPNQPLFHQFVQTLQFALILTVAAIPVALPAVLSVTMAVGATKLSKQKAIVSRLVAIEEMAGMDVLCSDKTGTLTQNKLALGDPVLFDDQTSADELVRDAALASRAEDSDPIEQAIFHALPDGAEGLADWTIEHFEPFDPVTKRTEATVSRDGRTFKVSKGAAQAIVELCGGAETLKQRIGKVVDDLAGRGYRTLAVARAEGEKDDWRLLGVLPLSDPPREDSAQTIASARKMGVDVKMVTGDHLAIAKETAQQLKLGQNLYAADEAFGDQKKMNDRQIESADGFAQVFPEHKYHIVEALQACGHYVGMTGDGVNDAPALKRADVGVAVSGATDAARGAADLVLTAPGLSVIIDAIRESRRIFQRMNSYAIYRIAETTRVLLFMTLSILIFNFYPVTAVMIILLALLNDGPIMLIAYDRTVLPPRPVRWDMHKVLFIASVLGVMGVLASFLWFWIGERVLVLDRQTIQTLMFLKLSVAGHLTIYLARTGEHHFWQKPRPALRLVITAESLQIIATLLAVYGAFGFMTPIGWKLAGLTWAYAGAWFLVTGFVKVFAFRLIQHMGHRGERQHMQRIHRRLHANAT